MNQSAGMVKVIVGEKTNEQLKGLEHQQKIHLGFRVQGLGWRNHPHPRYPKPQSENSKP